MCRPPERAAFSVGEGTLKAISRILVAAWLLFAAIPAWSQVADTANGKLRGITSNAVTAFKGIPFAAPPVGPNRWRPPQPAADWAGIRDASEFGHDCMQPPKVGVAAQGPVLRTEPSEDCLYLNVWKPAEAKPGDKLPVIVWIYGGAYISGGTSADIYSGHNFARDGVIMVSVNYRVGRFGFFAHPGLAAEGIGGNFGILDQIAALEWVKANIEAFGGDAERVTIFGYSAGGWSGHMLLQSLLARGLFSGVIIQSGGGRSDILRIPTLAEGAALYDRAFPGLTAEELRAMPAERIVGGMVSATTTEQTDYSGAMIDGRTTIDSALSATLAGITADVPVIIGANGGDGFPMQLDKEKTFASFGSDSDLARQLYDPDGTGDPFSIAIQANADRLFIEPARAVARAMAAKGGDVWLYRFDAMNPIWADVSSINPAWSGSWGGAPHGAEVAFVFDNLPARRVEQLAAGEQRVADLMHRYWVNFAKTGRPDGLPGVPKWPQTTPADTMVQFIDFEGARHPVLARPTQSTCEIELYDG
jgi:para-nitrobenzyl esterase